MLRSWNHKARWTRLLVVSVMLVPLPSLARAQDGSKNPNEQKNAGEAERLEDERPVNGGPANELIREFVIEGTCTDADHAPLADVNLQLYASGNDRNRPLQLVSETKTDEQGTFRFSDLEPPRPRPSETNPRHVYTLVATSTGRATSVHSIGSTHLQAPCHLVLWNSRTLRGRVTNAAGNPIEGAMVSTDRATLFRRLGDEFSRTRIATTDADGNYEIEDVADFDAAQFSDPKSHGVSSPPPTMARLLVDHPDYGAQTFDIPTSSTTLNAVVTRLATLDGQVVDGVTQMPVPNIALVVEQPGELPIHVKSDDQGVFQLTCRPGNYTIRSLTAPPHAQIGAKTFGVVSGENPPLELELIRDGVLEGTVLDLRGRPISQTDIARLRIGINEQTAQRRLGKTRAVTVDDDGTYRLHVPPGEIHPFVFSNRPLPRHFIADREPETADEHPAVTVGSGETVKLNFFIDPL